MIQFIRIAKGATGGLLYKCLWDYLTTAPVDSEEILLNSLIPAIMSERINVTVNPLTCIKLV